MTADERLTVEKTAHRLFGYCAPVDVGLIREYGDARVAEARKTALEPIREMVDAQAKDGGLWFAAQTAPEAYLQQELRKLHALVEQLAASPAPEGKE